MIRVPFSLQIVSELCQLRVGLIRNSPLAFLHLMNIQHFLSFLTRLSYVYDVMMPCLAVSNPKSRKITVDSNILYKLLQKLKFSAVIVFHFPFVICYILMIDDIFRKLYMACHEAILI